MGRPMRPPEALCGRCRREGLSVSTAGGPSHQGCEPHNVVIEREGDTRYVTRWIRSFADKRTAAI